MYNELRAMGFVGYFDGTGGLVRIRGCTKKGHLFHSKLSFQPREILWNKTEFEYGCGAHYALTSMEHMGHRQSGKVFAQAWKTFQQTADNIHGDETNLLPNPLIVLTDCAGEYQNGIIVALRSNKQVANRIVMNNVTLIILFWYEYEKGFGDEEQTQLSALAAYWFYELLVPAGVHSC